MNTKLTNTLLSPQHSPTKAELMLAPACTLTPTQLDTSNEQQESHLSLESMLKTLAVYTPSVDEFIRDRHKDW